MPHRARNDGFSQKSDVAQAVNAEALGLSAPYLNPPVTCSVSPVMQDAPSEARKATTEAISSTLPTRRIGMAVSIQVRSSPS